MNTGQFPSSSESALQTVLSLRLFSRVGMGLGLEGQQRRWKVFKFTLKWVMLVVVVVVLGTGATSPACHA